MINQQAMKDWVAKLRSGEYQQAKSRLQVDGKFCCLGVLCEIAIESGIDIDTVEKPDVEGATVLYDSRPGTLPDSVVNWSGISPFGNLPEEVDGHGYLTDLNDHANYTFDQIADVIEDQFIDR